MKKLLFIFVAFLLVSSCDKEAKEPDGYSEAELNDMFGLKYEKAGLVDEIEVSSHEIGYIEPGDWNNRIDMIALLARIDELRPANSGYDPAYTLDNHTLAETYFGNDGATLVLPQDPPEILMRDIVSDFPAGLTISDKNARTIADVQIIFNWDDLSYMKKLHRYHNSTYLEPSVGLHNECTHIGKLIYCDRPATVSGTSTEDYLRYDLSLLKGWNVVVYKDSYLLFKTTVPAGFKNSVTHSIPEGMMWKIEIPMGGL